MAKEPNSISIPLRELLECLVNYSEYLDAPPPYAETIPDHEVKPNKRSFILNTPKQKLEAIETILFGDEDIKKIRGNKGFKESDIPLVRAMHKEMEETGATKISLLPRYAELAKKRTEDADVESVLIRLDRLHQELKRQGKLDAGNYDYTDFDNIGDNWRDEYIADEIRTLSPWLEKYRDAILKYYSS